MRAEEIVVEHEPLRGRLDDKILLLRHDQPQRLQQRHVQVKLE